MNVKLQAMLNAAHYVEHAYSKDVLKQILVQCSPQVRERCETGIAITWHPLGELNEFLLATERVIADPNIGEKVGAAGARANTRGVMLRIAMLLARPEYVMRRAASMWRQFNDAGELTLKSVGASSVEVEIVGIPRAPRIFCDTITGWAREMVTSAGGKKAIATHAVCRSKGATRCVWLVRWGGDSA